MFVVFIVIIIPIFNYLTNYFVGTTISPDTSLFYSIADLKQIADIYGSNGAIFYLFSRLTFDFMFPFVYFAFLWMITKKIALDKMKPFIKKMLIIVLVFDFLENIFVSIVLLGHPYTGDFIYGLALISSTGKWILLFASILTILTSFLIRRLLHGK